MWTLPANVVPEIIGEVSKITSSFSPLVLLLVGLFLAGIIIEFIIDLITDHARSAENCRTSARLSNIAHRIYEQEYISQLLPTISTIEKRHAREKAEKKLEKFYS